MKRTALLVIGMLFLCSGAEARTLWPGQYDGVDPETQKWFNGLGQPDKRPQFVGCCSVADCRTVETRLTPEGSYQVKIEDEWMDFPPEKVEKDEKVLRANPMGKPVACWVGDKTNKNIRFYCLEPYDILG